MHTERRADYVVMLSTKTKLDKFSFTIERVHYHQANGKCTIRIRGCLEQYRQEAMEPIFQTSDIIQDL